ncbi:hypothetical protein [Pandoraea oxalativorans]|uniref:hypothetical protein n=1 Tax=Pandoraea oxalativorans TaxID=573737 RepID=UPI0012F48BCE|nr:hypothetical protein [Pandoraea oxalativorans]
MKLYRIHALRELARWGAAMAEKPTSGELFVNGDFATGDFTGWTVVNDEYMSVVPNEGRRVAVLKPVPYGARIYLSQLVVRDRSDGDYVVGFWVRTSDANGDSVPGVTRRTAVQMWVHPRDNLGDGLWRSMSGAATSSWAKYTWQFSIKGRRNQDFEIVFQNERRRPDGLSTLPAGRDGYHTILGPNEGAAPAALDDDDNCSFAVRDVTLFRA